MTGFRRRSISCDLVFFRPHPPHTQSKLMAFAHSTQTYAALLVRPVAVCRRALLLCRQPWDASRNARAIGIAPPG